MTHFESSSHACRPPSHSVIYCEPADLGGSPIWRFFCPYCGHWHTHGVGEGWRVAHCTDAGRRNDSPYIQNGYYLVLDPRFERGGER